MIELFWWSPLRLLPHLRMSGARQLPSLLRVARTSGRVANFGDELSPLVFAHLSGDAVRWASPARASALGVGSIVELYLSLGGRGAQVWGSGVKGDVDGSLMGTLDRAGCTVSALRGPLSASRLGLADVAHGDPGVFAPELLRRFDGRSKRVGPTSGRLVLVPHFSAWSSARGKTVMSHARRVGLSTVSPFEHPIDVLRQISQSAGVVTTSLHAIIAAHSLQIPVLRLMNGSLDEEPDFKYLDYATGLGVDLPGLEVDKFLQLGESDLINAVDSSRVEHDGQRAEVARDNLRSVFPESLIRSRKWL